MCKELKPAGLYDSDTDQSLYVIKEVEITEFCPGEPPSDDPLLDHLLKHMMEQTEVWLVYTQAKRGPIVMLQWRDKEGRPCSWIHWFLNELDNEMECPGDAFGRKAKRLGLSKYALRQLMEANAPSAPATDESLFKKGPAC